MKTLISLFTFLLVSVTTSSAVNLPAIFSDHMVLQQNDEVIIWGWGKPLEKIEVRTGWDQEATATEVNPNAQWQVKIPTPAAGGPYEITIQGYNTIVLKDILIGEVWLCSGQSNMEWSARAGIDNAEEEIKNANHPNIRFFNVIHRTAETPQIDLEGTWTASTPETMIDFSAIAYFFGRELQKNLDVPIGLINSSWGGTPAEVWVNAKVIAEDTLLASEAAKINEMPWSPKDPGYAYNTMIAPLVPYKIAGALWYQGETNTYSPVTYSKMLATLIESWRSEWNEEFPFYYVQIAPYKYGRPLEGAVLRDAQRRTLAEVSKTGMVVISDIGNPDDIHPTNKLDVGLRLANWALADTYRKDGIPVSGPLYQKMEKEGKKLRIYFDYAESGLVSKGKLTSFEIAGPDKNFVPAQAKIDGNTVVLSSREVKDPVAARFAFTNTAEPNLFNKEGLPASTFRTDDWEIVWE